MKSPQALFLAPVPGLAPILTFLAHEALRKLLNGKKKRALDQKQKALAEQLRKRLDGLPGGYAPADEEAASAWGPHQSTAWLDVLISSYWESMVSGVVDQARLSTAQTTLHSHLPP